MAETRALRQKWERIQAKPHEKVWEDWNVFYQWCWKSGYKLGDTLTRIDKDKPFGPGNCRWRSDQDKIWTPSEWDVGFCKRWAKTVNRWRPFLGLPLLPEE